MHLSLMSYYVHLNIMQTANLFQIVIEVGLSIFDGTKYLDLTPVTTQTNSTFET